MPKFLSKYLMISGLAAAVSLGQPELVVVGYYMLILPGLALELAPTAFLWGIVYAGCWYFVRAYFMGCRAVGIAFLSAAAVLCILPLPSILAARVQLALHKLEDVRPRTPIRLRGDVRVETAYSTGCNSLCLALLFEPGVDSVTINQLHAKDFAAVRDGASRLESFARAYRLRRKANCAGDSATEIDLDTIAGLSSDRRDARAQALAWASALSSDYCLVGEKPLDHYDFLLRSGRFNAEGDQKAAASWVMPLGSLSGAFAEIRERTGNVLYRAYYPSVRTLDLPFHIAGNGSPDLFRFDWSKHTLPERSFTEQQAARTPGFVAALAISHSKASPDAARAAARKALEAALDDPAAGPQTPVFKSINDYLEMVEAAGPQPEDSTLVERLLRDPRIGANMSGAYLIPRLFEGAPLEAMKTAILAKILATPIDADPQSGSLGVVLDKWPAGAFARSDPTSETLLADPVRRRRATGLIARQSDRGVAAAPHLTEIVEYHVAAANTFRNDRRALPRFEKYGGYAAHNSATTAALAALCRLGPAAHESLQRIDALTRNIPDGLSAGQWDRVLVRLGKPIAAVQKPNSLSGTTESYQRNLQSWLDTFDSDN